jgi:hypothetical protein
MARFCARGIVLIFCQYDVIEIPIQLLNIREKLSCPEECVNWLEAELTTVSRRKYDVNERNFPAYRV